MRVKCILCDRVDTLEPFSLVAKEIQKEESSPTYVLVMHNGSHRKLNKNHKNRHKARQLRRTFPVKIKKLPPVKAAVSIHCLNDFVLFVPGIAENDKSLVQEQSQ